MSLDARKQVLGVPTSSDINRPVQSQKQARSLKFWIQEEKKLYCVAKTKALISLAVTAKLMCAFVLAQAKIWFSHNAAHIYGYTVSI